MIIRGKIDVSCNILCPLPQPHRNPQDDHFGTSYQQWLSSVEVSGVLRKGHAHCPMIKPQGTRTLFFIPVPMWSQLTALPPSCLTSPLPTPDTADKPPSQPRLGCLGTPGCGTGGRDSVPVQSGQAPRYRDSQVCCGVLPSSGMAGGWVSWTGPGSGTVIC